MKNLMYWMRASAEAAVSESVSAISFRRVLITLSITHSIDSLLYCIRIVIYIFFEKVVK